MPEDVPTPKKSLKQLEKENNKSLKQRFKNWQKINLCVIIIWDIIIIKENNHGEWKYSVFDK